MTQSLHQIFEQILKRYKAKQYTRIVINKSLLSTETAEGSCFEPEPQKLKIKKIKGHEAQTEAINFLLYKWFKSRKDNRYKTILDYVYKPINIKIKMKDIPFDDLLAFLSPQTIETMKDNKPKESVSMRIGKLNLFRDRECRFSSLVI